ncbi:MAG: glycosyltransferase [Pseudomonadota bacterium]
MKILFLHDNFPAQFGKYGQFLQDRGWQIAFGTKRKNAEQRGFHVFNYDAHRENTEGLHPYVANFERACINGQGAAREMVGLRDKGYFPDVVMAHSGWGPGMFVKDVWPRTTYISYQEWYYQPHGSDVVFLSAVDGSLDTMLRSRTRNATILTDLAACDGALTPTKFQHTTFPEGFNEKLRVFHDGVDIDSFAPAPGTTFKYKEIDLSDATEVITYVARGMEPYRGFPEFMAACEILLRERPDAHVVVVGQDRSAYGKPLPDGDTFKKKALREHSFDEQRLHFTGLLPRQDYRRLLLASSVHVYLTVPFVLSWSMMEAMSTGCALVASDVAPVREIIGGTPNAARLVDHRNPQEIATAVQALLDDPDERRALGVNARDIIVRRYSEQDLMTAKTHWLTDLVEQNRAP